MSGPAAVDSTAASARFSRVSMVLALVAAMRPRQWVKNGFLFAPLVFSRNLFHVPLLLRELAAFGLFCAIASAVYLANDLLDAPEDRNHPVKRHRPIACGRLPVPAAQVAAATLAAGAAVAGFWLSPTFGVCLVAYLVMNAAYTGFLKKVAYVDVVVIATGFVLRVLAGAQAIEVPTSLWLFACTFALALFLGLGKRKHELLAAMQAGDEAEKARKVLGSYDLKWIDRWLLGAGAMAVASYVLYTVAPETHAKFGTYLLVLTLPFPAFGIWRFNLLVGRSARASSPTEALITDAPFVSNMALWLVSVVTILYRFGQLDLAAGP